MKKIYLVILYTLISFSIKAQKDSLLTYSAVVMVDSATKTQLFERARLWFADYFVSSKAVLEIIDKENGELVGRPILTCNYEFKILGTKKNYPLDVNVMIRVKVKDGKYKYEVYDLYDKTYFGTWVTSDVCPKEIEMVRKSKADDMWMSAKKGMNVKVNELASSLNSYMNKKGSISTDNF